MPVTISSQRLAQQLLDGNDFVQTQREQRQFQNLLAESLDANANVRAGVERFLNYLNTDQARRAQLTTWFQRRFQQVQQVLRQQQQQVQNQVVLDNAANTAHAAQIRAADQARGQFLTANKQPTPPPQAQSEPERAQQYKSIVGFNPEMIAGQTLLLYALYPFILGVNIFSSMMEAKPDNLSEAMGALFEALAASAQVVIPMTPVAGAQAPTSEDNNSKKVEPGAAAAAAARPAPRPAGAH
ncbi:MAG: hypothetical protein V4490_04285 [Pseudomonadota bacterium]